MYCYLNDGSHELIGGTEQDVQFRRVIEEKLGRDMVMCFDDVLDNYRDRMEEISRSYLEQKVSCLQNRIDMLLGHFDDYMKLPDKMKEILKAVKKEMDEMVDNYEILE